MCTLTAYDHRCTPRAGCTRAWQTQGPHAAESSRARPNDVSARRQRRSITAQLQLEHRLDSMPRTTGVDIRDVTSRGRRRAGRGLTGSGQWHRRNPGGRSSASRARTHAYTPARRRTDRLTEHTCDRGMEPPLPASV